MPIVVAVLGVIIVGLGAVLFFMPDGQAPATTDDTVEEANRTEEMQVNEETVVETTPNPTPETGTLGVSYTEDAEYMTPARTEHKIAVTLTVANGIVTDANVVYDGGDGYSNPNQERFDAVYKSEVVGKSLSEISLSRVGGASLTSTAFNEAVAKIVAEQA